MSSAFVLGFGLSFSLILAIGAQNAFVFRQGLKREYVGTVVTICALSDAILILLGVFGVGQWLSKMGVLAEIIRYAGVAFLVYYAFTRFHDAWRGIEAPIKAPNANTRRAVIATCLALTWLNPHVYIDTILLIGNIASEIGSNEKPAFAMGAVLASFVFFVSLGYGARALTPVFNNPRAWRFLDTGIGIFMLLIAYWLFTKDLGQI